MSYDKESVERLKDIGALDSDIDALVLSMTPEERKNLMHEFKKGQPEPSPKSSEMSSIAIHPPKRKKNSFNFFSKIVDFFKRLFFGKEAIKYIDRQKEVREIRSVLTTFGGGLYDFEDDCLTALFPAYLFRLYLPLHVLSRLYEEVFQRDDQIPTDQSNFFLEFMETLLSKETKQILKRFNTEALTDLYEADSESEALLKNDLDEFENSLYKYDRETIMMYSRPFEILMQIHQADFNFIFRVFCPDYDFDINNRPTFRPGSTGTTGLIIDRLRELNGTLLMVNNLTIPENVYIHFNDVLSGIKTKVTKELEQMENEPDHFAMGDDDGGYDHEQRLKPSFSPKYTSIDISQQTLKELLQDIQSFNTSRVIDSIVRYYTQKYGYRTKKDSLSPYFYNRYLEMIRYRVNTTFSNIHKKITIDKINRRICDFYQIPSITGLMYIHNYDDTMNIRFMKKQLPIYDYVLPLAFLKTFYHKYFAADIKKYLDIVMIEADFIDRTRGKDFSTQYANFIKKMDDLNDFEKNLVDSKDTQKNIMRFLTGVWSEKQYKNATVNKIREINEGAELIIQESIDHMKRLREYIFHTLSDMKTHNPSFVNNVKNLGGVQHKLLITNLIKYEHAIHDFLELYDAIRENV